MSRPPVHSSAARPQVSDADNMNDMVSGIDNNRSEMEVCATSVKLPSFWIDHPEAWFIHIETLFNTKGIVRDNTKYENLIVSLPQEVIMSVIDIVQNPPSENRYSNLKSKLLERHSLSEQRKLDKLFSDSEIGDRKPSEFYRSLVGLAGRNINTDFLKNLWLRKLPRSLNIALVGSNVVNIDELLKLADNIWDVSNKTELCAVGSDPVRQEQLNMTKVVDNLVKITSNMCEQFNRLSVEISEVKQSVEAFRSRTPILRDRNRSRGRSSARGWLCRFHYRFGSKARRCEQPCSFVPRNQEN